MRFSPYLGRCAGALAALSFAWPVLAAPPEPAFAGKFSTRQQLAGPDCLALQWSQKPGASYGCSDGELAAWRAVLSDWRTHRLAETRYDDARYRNGALSWTQSSFVQPQMMVHERYFYDPVAGRYTVRRYLDDLKARYGGIDSVLIWPIYPNIGIDNRNQLDMITNLPGGPDGVRRMVAQFKEQGVRVLFPVMPWDSGTRDDGKPLAQGAAALMKALGADGVNGDTMTGVPLAFSQAAEAIGHPLAFEPEIAPNEDQLGWNVMSWGYFDYPYALINPAVHVAKFKWLEPRHMVHISDRWQRKRDDMLQFAFFNGIGIETWENVWGYWNRLTERDGEALRRIATISRAMAAHLVSPGWEPMTPTRQFGVLASRWPLAPSALYTLVNRNEYSVKGEQISVAAVAGMRYFDLYHGVELTPRRDASGADVLAFDLEAKGVGALLATRAPEPALDALLATMRTMSARPLASYSSEWTALPQRMIEQGASARSATAPAGMRTVPPALFDFKVHGVEVEGINQAGVDVQYPWEELPRRFHRQTMQIAAFHIDTYPVTNAAYKAFIDASGYRPADTQNYLRHWRDGSFAPDLAERPVVWISLDDARAYARWAGKRLPTSWEWQYAAQGTDGRLYPWGHAWDAARVPPPETGREPGPPARVDAHPAGASPFGVMDMVGNVWQWTDEFHDEHTRAAVLRGGSIYRPQGSHWYFPQAQRLDTHGKFLLMAPGMDRNAFTGFRCVKDGQP